MRDRDEDFFRPRVSPPRSKRSGQSSRFVSRVLRSASKAGPMERDTVMSARKGGGTKFGRGHVAAAFAGRGLDARSRRVVIKTRLVPLKKAGANSTSTHLRYIERDGVTKDGQPGLAYGPLQDAVDTAAFEERGRGDRHQFRFIVAPEDAESLDNLHRFTRELMDRMEIDLGTRLDWLAVDHWDTDNPHTHVVLRGKDQAGSDLVIARDYIAYGMRWRATELATEWLGPRTEQEIQQGLLREVGQERWTTLDRTLQQLADDGVVARMALADRDDRSLLTGRLRHLSTMGLADETSPGIWHVRPDTEATLRAMGERGDIIRTMQRALGNERRELVFDDHRGEKGPVVGRVLAKGLADELGERGYLIVDGVDGRAHYEPLPPRTELANWTIGSIVDVRTDRSGRTMDRTIAALTCDCVYSTSVHRTQLLANPDPHQEPEAVVCAYVRRLEALRRAGIVDRLADGLWRVPEDFASQAQVYDRDRLGGASIELCTHLPIERQVRAIGATWLDQQLVAGKPVMADIGFGAEVRDALAQRKEFLVEQGFAERRGTRVVLMRDLLATLRNRDLESAARSIEAESGLAHRPAGDGQRVSGIYSRSVLLASGRFALLDDGVGFSLVPWRPVIERRLGQAVTGVARGGDVSWDFSRQRGLGIG